MKKIQHLKIKNFDSLKGDLRRYLIKGGASTNAAWFYKNANDETWKDVILERIPFIEAVMDNFNTDIIRGGSSASIGTYLSNFQYFMHFVDDRELPLTLDEPVLKKLFMQFDEQQYFRAWGKKEIKQKSAYSATFVLATIISKVLKLPEYKQLKHFSRVIKSYKHTSRGSVSHEAEKQHLGDSQILGYYCVDIANSLTIEAVTGQLPLEVTTTKPDGSSQTVHLPLSIVNHLKNKRIQDFMKAKKACLPIEARPYKDLEPYRKRLVKLRIIAELVIFVFQTGMNVSQILKIQRRGFSYKAKGNSDWLVTQKKARARGPRAFSIYKAYKERLKGFITFVDQFYPDKEELFPLGGRSKTRRETVNYLGLISLLKYDDIPWIPPSKTRNTRVNYLNRLIGNPSISAEMAQHAKETFSQNYNKPSQQRAMSAMTVFWEGEPISLINSGCQGEPKSADDKPSEVIEPNCINQSGCLFCKSHRDIKSEEYVWSLVSFRKLKLIEAAQPIKREIPADLIINRLTEKIEDFKNLSEESRQWVDEALLRIEEGKYHPIWESIIKFWEPK